ncbi:hypothetical protein Ae201684_000888 [Aphanomyces euteiches]|uniref:SEC7 domain-containing protein n=1 Tax=Aphanomyces euteiches TaxID=100861 RepID=A0A6G0XV99_9STRA|nr:hypothetical protein Ae201684_000888 [Aphanomyces euteiches]KAH9140640.1 hypothetical protein AeRB84_015140 [Aphanomyces euteiches]KAH9148757.1 hypothetical protein AeRB84_008007 [Aphanomyces euteiches]KAH9150708.1 hypothetical protein AeRB84_006494 [Aphanomyces euteiches]KAH9152393.1 hypothetical protein AeRB84_005171 [Aphanomyces euteiches]
MMQATQGTLLHRRDEGRQAAMSSKQRKQVSLKEVDGLLLQGIAKFNRDAKTGIQFCIDNQIVVECPKSIAKFMFDYNAKLDKHEIGQYLSRSRRQGDDFCTRVLSAFVSLLDFTDLVVDDAVRKFLSYFRLPGEAQQIDRLLGYFATRYHETNPSLLPSRDAALFIAFSILMLQTDLHNPSIPPQRKMSKEAFIRANQGTGEDLPADFLGAIYDRTKKSPFALWYNVRKTRACDECCAQLSDQDVSYAAVVSDDMDFCEVIDSWSIVKSVSLCEACWGRRTRVREASFDFCEILPVFE